MTNREELIKALYDGFDDWGYSEGVIDNALGCPYVAGDSRSECQGEFEQITWLNCRRCKLKWLDREVDA